MQTQVDKEARELLVKAIDKAMHSGAYGVEDLNGLAILMGSVRDLPTDDGDKEN